MNASGGTILVTGATGKQGGAAARRLLADGWRVRAFTRDPSSAVARALEQTGAEVVCGDMDDRASLAVAMRGMYGVFSVQPTEGGGNAPVLRLDDEIRLGKNVADAAAEAGVRHFVYASVGGADSDSGVGNLEAKWEIERHLRGLRLPVTVFRPVSFMENFASPYTIRGGSLVTGIEPGVSQQVIAVADIGAFVALAFGDPESYVGEDIDIAGDDLTPGEISTAISRATGRQISYERIPMEELRSQNENAARAIEWANEKGGFQAADIPKLRELHPGLMDFETWLQREGKAKLEELFSMKEE